MLFIVIFAYKMYKKRKEDLAKKAGSFSFA